ncbi:MAG: cyclase family protein [Pseudomonadota bacterium]
MITANLVKIFLALTLCLASAKGFAENCKPSKWGADDEIGSANYVSPEQVLAAVKLVKQGQSHPLGIVIDQNTPAFPPRYLRLQVVQPGQHSHGPYELPFGWDAVYTDDLAQLWLGIGSQLDGLGHMGEAGYYYNCNRGADFIDVSGLKKLGTHQVPPMIGRGVLLDMTRHFSMPMLPAGKGISAEDLKQAAIAQDVEIKQGDVVLIHTGWTDGMLKSDPAAWGSGEPGLTNDAARHLASLNPMAVGADTWGIEAIPAIEGDKTFYGHVIFLKENGIYLLETMDTGRLAQEGVKEFLFVLGQARIRGTVQMVINPVAMW